MEENLESVGDAAPRVLVVAPPSRTRQGVVRVLERLGCEVSRDDGSPDREDALSARVRTERPQIVLFQMGVAPSKRVFETLSALRTASPSSVIIVLTHRADAESQFQAWNRGAFDHFELPVRDWSAFGQVLMRALEVHRLRVREKRLERARQRPAARTEAEGLEEIIGQSRPVRMLRERVARLAPTRAPVLIQGESGTGKELVARALHRASPWRRRPFLDIDCGGLPHELMESELFGHEAGAFTSARGTKPGLFEVVEDGTVFLDEVGELPLTLQGKLLRVLESRTFRRVGGTRTCRLEARIVTATNQDLRKLSRQGRFRPELFHRLAVLHVRVPPLRERREDVPLLVWHFVSQFNREYDRNVRRIPKALMQELTRRSWSDNNVRELRNAVLRATVLSDGESLQSELFEDTAAFSESSGPPAAPSALSGAVPVASTVALSADLLELPYREFKEQLLDTAVRGYLERLLAHAGGNISLAARRAGQDRTNFRRLLRRHDVEPVTPPVQDD